MITKNGSPERIQCLDSSATLDVSDSNTNNTHTIDSNNVAPAAIKRINRRDERRRATHNAIERRRRDKINNWITKLGNIIPSMCEAGTRHGSIDGLSKGGILAKACEYITELKDANESLHQTREELKAITKENIRLRKENEDLRAVLLHQGIRLPEEDALPLS